MWSVLLAVVVVVWRRLVSRFVVLVLAPVSVPMQVEIVRRELEQLSVNMQLLMAQLA